MNGDNRFAGDCPCGARADANTCGWCGRDLTPTMKARSLYDGFCSMRCAARFGQTLHARGRRLLASLGTPSAREASTQPPYCAVCGAENYPCSHGFRPPAPAKSPDTRPTTARAAEREDGADQAAPGVGSGSGDLAGVDPPGAAGAGLLMSELRRTGKL